MAHIRKVVGGAPGAVRLRWWPAGLPALLVLLAIWLGSAGTGSAGLEDNESEVPAEAGVTVQGSVVDAKTGKPVQGAQVAPMVFRSPGTSPEWARKVETDADGKFTLEEDEGIPAIQVAHPDYYDFECDFYNEGDKKPGEKLYVVRVALKSGEKLTGVVKDPAGKPLAAVEVEDLAGKKTVSGEDGRFALKSIRLNGDGKYYLTVEAKGYIGQTLQPEKIPAEEITIVLEPLLRIPGRVLAPDGQPVRQFTVAAGPGRNPSEFQCERAEVDDPQGRWELRTEQRGTHWVGVRAEGFAPWEGWTEVGKQNEPFTVRLQSGVSVTGKVRGPRGNVREARIVLTPQRADGDGILSYGTPSRDMGVISGVSRADGMFRLEHVRPDNYLLSVGVGGKGMTPLDLSLAVPAKGLDCGELTVQGTGRIVGVLHDPKEKGRPQPFESGAVVSPYPGAPLGKSTDRSIFFKAAEQGRFTVEDVPAGPVSVEFSYMLSSDCVDTYGRTAIVTEGRTTEVRFFDPKKAWDLPLQVVVGDGSEGQFNTGTGMAAARKVENVTTRTPMFLVELEPEPGQTVSFPRPDWYEVDGFGKTRIAVPDVHPGKYRLGLSDFHGSIGMKGPVYEAPITVPANSPIVIPLAASSIIGRAQWTTDYHRLVMVAAVEDNRKAPPRYAYCDEKGNFCLRYLSPGQYTICLHDDDAGYSRLDYVVLAEAVTITVKPPTLRPGGTIAGTVRWTSSRPLPDHLTVTDAQGIVIGPREHFRGLNGGEYRFGGLWPGRWTLAAWSGKDRLASAQIDVRGEETISRVLNLDGNEKAENTMLPQSKPKPDPSAEPMIDARFTARVEWLEIEGKRKADVVPVEIDPHWLVGIEILSVEKPAKPLDKKGKAVLLIHSPARLFAGEEAKAPGRTYSFKVSGTMRDGHLVFHAARAEENKKVPATTAEMYYFNVAKAGWDTVIYMNGNPICRAGAAASVVQEMSPWMKRGPNSIRITTKRLAAHAPDCDIRFVKVTNATDPHAGETLNGIHESPAKADHYEIQFEVVVSRAPATWLWLRAESLEAFTDADRAKIAELVNRAADALTRKEPRHYLDRTTPVWGGGPTPAGLRPGMAIPDEKRSLETLAALCSYPDFVVTVAPREKWEFLVGDRIVLVCRPPVTDPDINNCILYAGHHQNYEAKSGEMAWSISGENIHFLKVDGKWIMLAP